MHSEDGPGSHHLPKTQIRTASLSSHIRTYVVLIPHIRYTRTGAVLILQIRTYVVVISHIRYAHTGTDRLV